MRPAKFIHRQFQVEYWTPAGTGALAVYSYSAKEAVAATLRFLKDSNPTLDGCGAKVRKPAKGGDA